MLSQSLRQGHSHGGPGGKLPPQKFILPLLPKKQFYLVVTSEFLLHFRPNWHQNNKENWANEFKK